MKDFYFKSLQVAMLLLCCGIASAHDFEVDGLFYNITDEDAKTVEVTFEGETYSEVADEYSGWVTIPGSVVYNGDVYSVTGIGTSAFRQLKYLQGIAISNSVTIIGDYAFTNCVALREVEFGNAVTTIGTSAFSSCRWLPRVDLPASVATVSSRAFSSCERLAFVTTGEGLTTVGAYAFNNCTALRYINFGDNVTSIDYNALSGCSNLEVVLNTSSCNLYPSNSPQVITKNKLSEYVFDKGFILKPYTAYGALLIYTGKDAEPVLPADCAGQAYYIGKRAFYNCDGIKRVVVPSSVLYIDDEAFMNCDNLEEFSFPSSRDYGLGMSAFENCRKLKNVELGNVQAINVRAFFKCRSLKSILLPSSLKYIYNYAFNGCTHLAMVVSKASETPSLAPDESSFYEKVFSDLPDGAVLKCVDADKYSAWSKYFVIDDSNAGCYPEEPAPTQGDVNADGNVNIADVTTIVSMILNNVLFDEAADVNGDDVVNIADVTTIVAFILNGGDVGGDTPAIPTTGEAVDLGLSVKWASYNVGATAPEEFGGYYAWGETEEKNDYSWSTYKYCNGDDYSMTKYCVLDVYGAIDNKTTLAPEDDVASVKWGGAWHLPTRGEILELCEDCSWTWKTLNGVQGYNVTGPNGNTIFLPSTGVYHGTSIIDAGSWTQYQSSSLDKSYCNGNSTIFIRNGFYKLNHDYTRDYGRPARPVCE